MRDINLDEDRNFVNRARIGGEALLARLILNHPEQAPEHLRPKPPPKPEPEPISPEPAPIPEIIITDELLRSVTVRAIQDFVCREYDISREKLCSDRRSREFLIPRHIAIYLADDLTELSLPVIGRLFCRDHTSILHAINVMTKRRASDQALHDRISALKSRFLSELAPESVT